MGSTALPMPRSGTAHEMYFHHTRIPVVASSSRYLVAGECHIDAGEITTDVVELPIRVDRARALARPGVADSGKSHVQMSRRLMRMR